MRCSKHGCRQDATVMPIFLAWAKKTPEKKRGQDNAMRMIIKLPLCVDHGNELDPKEFMTDNLWDDACEALKQFGKEPADRKSVVIELQPITAATLQAATPGVQA